MKGVFMKKLSVLLLSMVLLIACVGSASAADLLDQIREKGFITIAMEGTWSPWTFHNEDDELVGYDVEVGKALAEHLGVEPNFIEGPWDGLLAGLEVGRYDIMINGVGITEERQKKYDFSTPYAYNKPVVIVREDNDSIHAMEDLKGKRTANTITSLFAETAEKYGADVIGVDDLNQTLELVLSGRIDATLNTEVTYFEYMRAHPDSKLKIAAYGDDVTSIGIPIRKGEDSAALLEAVNAALAEMAEKGVLTELSEKYFGTDISVNTK
jgi:cystine transport system substrate-binding protein